MITGTAVDGDGVEDETARYFQSPEGRMPLNPVETGAHCHPQGRQGLGATVPGERHR